MECRYCKITLVNDRCPRCLTTYEPTAEEILERCREIQKTWDAKTEKRRRCVPTDEVEFAQYSWGTSRKGESCGFI
jgi:hypothetical protein